MYRKRDGNSRNTTRRLLILIVGLGVGVFILDLSLPLGVGNSVLYGGLVILSFLLPYRKGPLITAIICSTVDMTDIFLKPTLEGVPLWMGVTNRLFSLTAIWLPLLFFLHRRRAEELLQRAHDELERVWRLAHMNSPLRIKRSSRRSKNIWKPSSRFERARPCFGPVSTNSSRVVRICGPWQASC